MPSYLKFFYGKNIFVASIKAAGKFYFIPTRLQDYFCGSVKCDISSSRIHSQMFLNSLILIMHAQLVWYPNLNCSAKNIASQVQVGFKKKKKKWFRKINWLHVDYRFRNCLAGNVFKFFDDRSPVLASYMKDVFDKSCISQSSFNQKKKLHNETKTNTKEDHLWSKLQLYFSWLHQFFETTC